MHVTSVRPKSAETELGLKKAEARPSLTLPPFRFRAALIGSLFA